MHKLYCRRQLFIAWRISTTVPRTAHQQLSGITTITTKFTHEITQSIAGKTNIESHVHHDNLQYEHCDSKSQKCAPGGSASTVRSFHKRPLPGNLVALSSRQGKQLFREALTAGGMESFFPLSEQFVTQSEPSFCSLSSLAMVLNALRHDPKRVWKAPWRWVSEEMLQCEGAAICGHSLERVRQRGMDFAEFESLARCHGVRIRSHRCHVYSPPRQLDMHDCVSSSEVVTKEPGPVAAARADVYLKHQIEQREKAAGVEVGLAQFREEVVRSCRDASAYRFVISNFCRRSLGQTGSGHFSPVGGYHAERDLVLVMDVARFKYPPYWVPLQALWDAMLAPDPDTAQPRGYFVVSSWDEHQGYVGDGGDGTGGVCGHQHAHANQHSELCSGHNSNSASHFSHDVDSRGGIYATHDDGTARVPVNEAALAAGRVTTVNPTAAFTTCPPRIRAWQEPSSCTNNATSSTTTSTACHTPTHTPTTHPRL